jgi:hypothetical protein
MLYDINFIIGLLITLMLSTFAYFYFSQKIEQQNEKLNAVSMVVRAMAEEMSYFRNSGSAVLPKEEPFVETKVFEIGLANLGINGPSTVGGDPNRSNELQLIAVSDDEDEDEDEDSGSDEDEDSGSDEEEEESGSDEEDEESDRGNVDIDIDVDLDLDLDLNINEVEDLNENARDKKEENNENNENNENIKSVHMNVGDLEDLGIFEEFGESSGKLDGFLNMTETKVVEITEFKPSSDDDLIKASTTEYKKMSLSKLRSIVAEKKLCEDTSKMKKPELLELLKPFIGSME